MAQAQFGEALARGLAQWPRALFVGPVSLSSFRARSILLRRKADPFRIGRIAHQVGDRETKLRTRAKVHWIKHGRCILN